jgi:hypothetical protein
MSSSQRIADFERWVAEVRDPAEAADGHRVEVRRKKAIAYYVLAPIPNGWAMRRGCWFHDGTGAGTPWRPYLTRDEAAEAGLNGLIGDLRAAATDPAFATQAEALRAALQPAQPTLLDW